MGADATAVIGFVVLFALMLLRVPVGMAMGLVGVTGFGYIVGGLPALKMVGQTSMRTVADYSFGIIPMFLVMGAVVSTSGMSRELFRAGNTLTGHFKGGLGIATIAACAGFAAISGSSVATAATFSTVAYPEMRQYRYPQSFSTGVIAAGGTLGAMFPPSTVLAVYGLITQQDIGKLFIAGILPGLLAVSMYIATIAVIGFVRPDFLPAGRRSSWSERLAALRQVWAPLLLFVLVIGGLYGGVFTPTEAGGAGAAAAVAAAGDAHRRGDLHRPHRRAAVRLFPHGDADAAERDGVPHQPRPRPLRRARPDHADVSRAGLPDGRTGDDHPDGAHHLSRDHGAGLRPDLVRRHHRDDRGAGADPSAGRHERLCHQVGGAGSELPHHLHRRAPLHRHRHPAPDHSHRLPRHRHLPARAHALENR